MLCFVHVYIQSRLICFYLFCLPLSADKCIHCTILSVPSLLPPVQQVATLAPSRPQPPEDPDVALPLIQQHTQLQPVHNDDGNY